MASIFSGKAGRNAAIVSATQAGWQADENRGYLGDAKGQADKWVTSGYEQSLPALAQGYETSRGDLQGGLTNARGDITYGRDQGINAVNQGYGSAITAAGQYYDQGTAEYERAAQGYDPLIASGMRGLNMYESGLGLQGPEGRAAAEAAFKEGPGYNWQVNQATGAAQRAASKTGGLYGGNTAAQVATLGSNLANQEYGAWLNRLQGFQGAAQNAVAGQAGVLQNKGQHLAKQGDVTSQLYANQGKDVAGLYTGAATGLANAELGTAGKMAELSYGYGQDQATMHTGYGQSMAGNALGYGQGMIDINNQKWGTIIPAGQAGMMAGQNASANKWGAIMGGLQLGSQVLGGGAGGGGGIFSRAFGGAK